MATLKKFQAALGDQIIEDHKESGGSQGLLDNRTGNYVTPEGELTDVFKTQLKELATDEARNFDEKLIGARPADKDLFGIKRRFCTICATDCSGYEPTKVLFGGRGEFPTFCRHCNCPAHFHSIEEEVNELPESLSQFLSGKNIQSSDLNYNCVLAAFMIKDGPNKIQIAIDIARLIKEEGIEILTSSCRFLTFNEAFYLRNRVVALSERKMAKTMAQDFQKQSYEAEIRKKGEIDTLNLNELGQNNEFLMERLSQIREHHITKMRTSFG